MVKGYVSVLIEGYLTSKLGRVHHRQQVYGFSHIDHMNTQNQKDILYKNALNHAGSKYLYGIHKDSDTEYNYYLLSSQENIVTIKQGVTTRIKRREVDITPSRKRILHKEQLQERSDRMQDKDKTISRERARKDAEPDYNKMTKAELVEYIKKNRL